MTLYLYMALSALVFLLAIGPMLRDPSGSRTSPKACFFYLGHGAKSNYLAYYALAQIKKTVRFQVEPTYFSANAIGKYYSAIFLISCSALHGGTGLVSDDG
jgi:hypothetical protein